MILDKDVKYVPVHHEVRYFQGRVVGIHFTFTCEYKGAKFVTQEEWEVPSEQHLYAEDFIGDRRNKMIEEGMRQTQVQIKTIEKIIDYRRQHES
jgi:hypothetical protein